MGQSLNNIALGELYLQVADEDLDKLSISDMPGKEIKTRLDEVVKKINLAGELNPVLKGEFRTALS